MIRQLIFLGPPASGKGTQTNMLQKEFFLPHIDTGGMLRAEIAKNSPEGVRMKELIDKGNLVPTKIVAKIVRERVEKDDCKNGFILDGYPRNKEQAEALEDILKCINKSKNVEIFVINLQVDDEKLVERIVNRRLCKNCGTIYNLLYSAPHEDSTCNQCGEKLIQRTDDTEEVAKARIRTYHEQTYPLIEYYENKGILYNIDGNGSVEEIYKNIKKVIRNDQEKITA